MKFIKITEKIIIIVNRNKSRETVKRYTVNLESNKDFVASFYIINPTEKESGRSIKIRNLYRRRKFLKIG